jgi:hypothetical protein
LAESFKTLNVIVRKEFSGRFKAFASKDIEQSFRKLTGQEILKVKNKKKKKKK